jgi:two-component system response regulator YesN
LPISLGERKLKQINIIIADDEPYICGMLQKLIDFDSLDLTLCACVNDGKTLEKKIEEFRPDIVLTDISMPQQDGLEVIRVTREKGIQSRFVIISGYRQFEYAYNALKYDVDDYLLKPVERAELNRVLKKICDDLRQVTRDDAEAENARLHAYLVEKGTHNELRSDVLSFSELNRNYHTNFQAGCFRMIMLKLDMFREEDKLGEDVSSMLNKLKNMGMNCLQQHCFDIAASEENNRILFLINYPQEKHAALQSCLQTLFTEAKNVVDLFQGFSLTLCVGSCVKELHRIEEAKTSCRRASWLRMYLGTDRVIYAEDIEEHCDSGVKKLLEKTEQELTRAYTAVDIDGAKQAFYRVFSLPEPVLCSTVCMLFIRENIHRLCEHYAQIVKDPTAVERSWVDMAVCLHHQTNFLEYSRELAQQLELYMTEMSEYVRKKNVKPILKARTYIEQHYAEHLTLESMAQLVNLSPIYFSNLFKKETGQNFTEYLTAYRMKVAKDLLRRGSQNINEIAVMLGYADARYFSKVFKKEVGVKPTDYRKIYG